MEARKQLAQNIRQYRVARNLSQENLAEKADLHRTYIGSVERGERNISVNNIERIARALDIEIIELFSNNDQIS